tara:strand:+ start:1238 stop:1648 length:411 start_codon:yes stop_codon:yes gene_type:complete
MSAKKVTLVNKEVLNLFQGLLAVKEMKGSRFAVLVAKNLKEMKKVLDPLDAMAIPTQEFQELSVEMNKLIEAEDGEAIKKLEESNSELIDARKEQLEGVNSKLEESSEVYIYSIKEDQLPEDITGEQIERLLEIIE